MANLKSFQHSIRAQANFIKHNFAFRYEYLFAIRFKVLCVSFKAVSVVVETLLALFRFQASLLLMKLSIKKHAFKHYFAPFQLE